MYEKSGENYIPLRVTICDYLKFRLSNEPGELSGTALSYGLDDQEVESRGGGLGIFLFSPVSRPALGPTQPPIQWVTGAPFLGIKRPGREVDRSPPSSAEVKECVELYLHSPNTVKVKCKVVPEL
jgi:hypothetical protein